LTLDTLNYIKFFPVIWHQQDANILPNAKHTFNRYTSTIGTAKKVTGTKWNCSTARITMPQLFHRYVGMQLMSLTEKR